MAVGQNRMDTLVGMAFCPPNGLVFFKDLGVHSGKVAVLTHFHVCLY